MSDKPDIVEGDWVTWDFVTFYKQDGRPVDDNNTFVVVSQDWRTELQGHMRGIAGATNLHGAMTNVWMVTGGGTRRCEQTLIDENR